MQPFFGVDIGNSGLRVAELQIATREIGSMLRIDWRYATSDAAKDRQPSKRNRYFPGDPEWLSQLDTFLAERAGSEDGSKHRPIRWLISSVRSDALEVLVGYLNARAGDRVQVVTYESLPLAVQLPFPGQVGIDRLLAAYAAIALTEARPLAVVQAGSAVTVDLVSACLPGGDQLAAFEGGAILPGVPMMLRMLGQSADRLPEIDADDLLGLPDLPGKNTEQAMLCGAASALVGGVMHLVARYREQYGPDLPIILSGGDGMRLSPYISGPIVVESHLVQRGLLRLAEFMTAQKNC